MTTKFSAPRPAFVASTSLPILVLVILTIPTLAQGKLPQKIELEGASFTLSAGLTIKYNDRSTGYYDLREFHSAWQWRSRIDYEAAGAGWAFANSRGTFYADDTQAFQVDSVFRRCSRTDQKSINAAFKMDFLGEQQDDQSRHVVGTVRLLSFIEKHSDEFRAAAPPDGNGEFSAKIGELSITVYYGTRGVSLPLGVPSKVIVVRPDGFQLVLKLMRVALLTPMELVYGDSSLPPGVRQSSLAGYDLLYDVFAAPPGLDCSKGAQTDADIRLVLSNPDGSYRFTFSARHSSQRGLTYPVPTIVGYEPELETLRVNQRFDRHTSQTWVSYRHDRVYTVISRTGGGGRGGISVLDTVLDSGASALTAGQEDATLSCVVAKASVATKLTDTCRNPHTLGTMLLGATNVVYMGLARVRGIEAHVFEARDSQLPVWLEQPTVYSEDELGQTLKSRIKSSAEDELGVKLTTVFYFSRTRSDHGANRLLNNKLLLIEIYKMSPAGTQLDKITIPVFEFAWELQTTAPNGQRTEDFYSLGDECMAPPGTDNHYAHISFNLKPAAAAANESGSEESKAWLRAPVKRNLALMRAVCDQFGVPPTIVYDFESGQGRAAEPLIWANMLAAERQEAPVSLVYLGRGTPTFSMFTVLAASGFQMCYQLASHKRQDTLFAYNGMRNTCYLYRLAMPRQDMPATSIFRPDKLSNFEMYKVVQRPSRKLVHDDYITKLDEMQARLISTGRVILTNPSEAGESPETRPKVFFSLTQVQVDHLNEKTAYDLDEHHLDDTNKFPGLGLLAEDPQMKLVEPKSNSNDDAQQVVMTFEQCHEACLIDVECESFSTCIVEGRVQCVLSSVDFKASTVVLQLMDLRDRQSKLGETFQVSLDESALIQDLVPVDEKSPNLGVVHIKKHPTCELHNKLYRDLFVDAGEMYVNLRDRLLRPVTHPEQCAEFCYLGTLATMRKETRRLQKTLRGDEHDPGLTEGYSAGHCGHYYFLDQQSLDSSRVKIPKEQIISMHTDGATRGYCLFDDGSDEPTTSAARRRQRRGEPKNKHAPEASQSLLLRKFELDFSVMYEREYGVYLLESNKSPEERSAYMKIHLEQDFSREHLDVMRKFLEQGGNSGQRATVASAQECARRCFTQLTPLWPACRSFEFYERVEKDFARRHKICTFNTATINQLTDLGRTDLVVRVGANGSSGSSEQQRVRVNEGDELRVWHYEPRLGLAASSLRERYQVSMDDSEWELDELSHKSVSRVHLGSLGLSFMICVLLTAGVAAGAWLQVRGTNRPNEDSEILVEREKDLDLNDMSQDELNVAGANGNGISEVE